MLLGFLIMLRDMSECDIRSCKEKSFLNLFCTFFKHNVRYLDVVALKEMKFKFGLQETRFMLDFSNSF